MADSKFDAWADTARKQLATNKVPTAAAGIDAAVHTRNVMEAARLIAEEVLHSNQPNAVFEVFDRIERVRLRELKAAKE
jgi:hypothetical protein